MAGTKAISSPSFIIRKDGKYYLTAGVLEYDPEKAKGDLTLQQGCDEVKKAFEAAKKKHQAAEVVFGTLTASAQTQPRHRVNFAADMAGAQTNNDIAGAQTGND